MEQNDFIKDVKSIQRRLKEADTCLKILQVLYRENLASLYSETLKLQILLEKATVMGRDLPYYTGDPSARVDVKKGMRESIPYEIGFTKEGWFSVRLPLLLPKKNSGSTSYLREFLYPAMMDFFKDKNRVRYKDCVIAYRHVYKEDYPEKGKRDHDNIEVNQVTDIIAMFVLPDDNSIVCNHYYTSGIGTQNRTEIYVLPKSDFVKWMIAEKTMPKEGIKLYETLQ